MGDEWQVTGGNRLAAAVAMPTVRAAPHALGGMRFQAGLTPLPIRIL